MKKKLGIIGGAGPLASCLFYESLVHESYRILRSVPEIHLLNFPFIRGLTLEEKEKNGAHLKEELSHCLAMLKKADCTHAILVCNTLHLVLKEIETDPLHFYSLPDLVLDEIYDNNARRLLLLGTQNTACSLLYQQKEITLFRLSAKEQKIVDEVIDHVLEGKILQLDSLLIEQIIANFSEEIDGVILGCTDLPVLHHHFPISSNHPVYDSVKIPAKTILRFI